MLAGSDVNCGVVISMSSAWCYWCKLTPNVYVVFVEASNDTVILRIKRREIQKRDANKQYSGVCAAVSPQFMSSAGRVSGPPSSGPGVDEAGCSQNQKWPACWGGYTPLPFFL
nr:hypothetical protein TGAMS_g8 [Trichoderma gamsii]